MHKVTYSEFTEAFMVFLMRNCEAYLPGGGAIGSYNPPYVKTEIKIMLNEDGSGSIETMDGDCLTVEFRTMDHFRSQGMITPEQRDEMDKLTVAKASKLIRQKNIELSKQNCELKAIVRQIKEMVNENEV